MYIDSSIAFYFIFVIGTEFGHFVSGDLSVWNVNVFFGNVDVVEEVRLHVIVVGFDVVVLDWIVLIQVKCHYVFERKLFFFMHSDQLFVDHKRCASSSKSECKCLTPFVFLFDRFFNDTGDFY